MLKEKALQNQVMLDCGKRGWLCFHFNPGGCQLPNGTYFKSGVPKGWLDLIIFPKNNKVFFAEMKIKPNKPTKEQIVFMQIMKQNGYFCKVIYNLQDWRLFISQLKF